MAKVNPKWQEAENARLEAEKQYAAYMNNRLEDSDEDRAEIERLNAAIEVQNKKVRLTRQHL